MTDHSQAGRPIKIERGLGCASIVPAGYIGFEGLTDGAGPQGWLGISELLGWLAVCVAVTFAVGALLAGWRCSGWRRYGTLALTVLIVVTLTWAMNWLGLDAPMAAKRLFTLALQWIGSITTAAAALWLGYHLWPAHRSR